MVVVVAVVVVVVVLAVVLLATTLLLSVPFVLWFVACHKGDAFGEKRCIINQ